MGEELIIEEVVNESSDILLLLDELIIVNSHLVNIENLLIVLLVAIGLCFGGICLLVFSRYVRG